jgi:serine/threonine protein phosphatase PrpC
LTDGALFDKTQATCPNSPNATLSQIQIFFDTTSPRNGKEVTLGSKSTPEAIKCADPAHPTSLINCSRSNSLSNEPVLVSFQEAALSFIALASAEESSDHALALTRDGKNGDLPPAGSAPSNITTYLTPQTLDVDTPNLELGTPLISDTTGKLTGLHTSSSTVTLDALSNLITRIPNNNQAGNASTSKVTPTATPSPAPTGTIVIPGTNLFLELWQLSILVLALLFLLVALIIRPRVQRHRAIKAEIDDADRRADVVAKQIEEMEVAQRNWMEHNQHDSGQLPVPLQQGLQDKTVIHKNVIDLRCPRCGEVVVHDANYCPNCREFLSPSESGLHLRIRPTESAVSANPLANAPARAVPPSAPRVPSGPLADQPTLPPASVPRAPTSPLADQPTIPPLPVPMSPIAEEPTIEVGSNLARKFGSNMYDETTVPFARQQAQEKHLGFVVGTSTNPGIKRKYKPNEDSLLAAQGLVGSAPAPQLFGLFVIADGMGGHANGQDASRLAIQMIVEDILPKLVGERAAPIDFGQVLVDGVQSANQAVHQQNMDQHGDMGTTITSALVVDNVAYVANVGDSRTYLYREADGLVKVTNDHSVVASLVEAGIIKPDDIYTHPKRNQIYRSLGEKANVEVDIFTVQLRSGDKLLLCSDGLWDMVRDPKIEEVVKLPVPNPSMTGDALIQTALDGGGEDNVSVVVVQIMEGVNPESFPRVQFLAKPDNVKMPQL